MGRACWPSCLYLDTCVPYASYREAEPRKNDVRGPIPDRVPWANLWSSKLSYKAMKDIITQSIYGSPFVLGALLCPAMQRDESGHPP